jgi:hypothetical protein
MLMSIKEVSHSHWPKPTFETLPLLIWVPIDRWVPEQVMQTKIPKFQEAQRGSVIIRKGFKDVNYN